MTDIDIANIADKFDQLIFAYTKKPRRSISKKNIQGSKNYKYFTQFVEVLNKCPNIDRDLFLEAQIYFAAKNSMYCNPSWLVTENAVRRYVDFLEIRSNTPVTYKPEYKKLVLESIKQSITFVTKKMNEYKLNTYNELFNYRKKDAILTESYLWIINNSITKPFLSVCKEYSDFYNKQDADVKKDLPNMNDLSKTRSYILLNRDLNAFCKSILREECNF